jgi:hypothetical protein
MNDYKIKQRKLLPLLEHPESQIKNKLPAALAASSTY